MRATVELVGLEGVRRKRTKAVRATSVTDAVRLIREDKTITASGSTGALNVWRDDDELWQCRFMQFQVTINSGAYTTKAAVAQWLKDWWPHLGR